MRRSAGSLEGMSPKRFALLTPLASAALVIAIAGVAQADQQSQLIGLQQRDGSGSQQLGVLSSSESGDRRQSQLLGAQQGSAEGQQQVGIGSRQTDDLGRAQSQLVGSQQQDAAGNQQQAGIGQSQSGGSAQQQAGALQQQSGTGEAPSQALGLDLDLTALTTWLVR